MVKKPFVLAYAVLVLLFLGLGCQITLHTPAILSHTATPGKGGHLPGGKEATPTPTTRAGKATPTPTTRVGKATPTSELPKPTVTLPPAHPSGNELRLYSEQPETLDPAIAQDVTSHRFVALIFSGLVALDSNLEVVPDLAESWEVDDSGTVYTFHLRTNARFHNGRAVTAKDVRYSLERACDPKRGSVKRAQSYLDDIVGVMERTKGQADSIAGVKVLDDYTIQITIDAPKPYFLAKLTYPTSYVVDRESVERDPDGWTDNPIGTGPFKLKEISDEKTVLVAFDDYYQGRPNIDRVTFYHRGQAVNMYERGQLDIVEIGVSYVDRVLDPKDPLHPDLRVVPQLDVWYIGFNCQKPPFDDPHVRRAFAYATNKKAIAEIVFNKMVLPAKGILPPGMPGYNPDLKGLDFDPDTAAEELSQSKYGDASELPPIILTVTGAATGEMLAEMYKQSLGVEIQVEVVDWGEFLRGLDEQKYQMFSLGWIADYPDPHNFLDLLFHSDSAYNHGAYSNPKVDALLEKARVEQDHDRRMALYRQVEQLLVQDAPWIPLYHSAGYYLVKPYVKELIITGQDTMNLRQVTIEQP